MHVNAFICACVHAYIHVYTYATDKEELHALKLSVTEVLHQQNDTSILYTGFCEVPELHQLHDACSFRKPSLENYVLLILE
jgi:hypothetical protein